MEILVGALLAIAAIVLLLILIALLDEVAALFIWALIILAVSGVCSFEEEAPVLSLPVPVEQVQQKPLNDPLTTCAEESGIWVYDECVK